MYVAGYFAVLVPVVGDAQVVSVAKADEFTSIALAAAADGSQVFFFSGFRLRVTEPPFRFLVLENGKQLPLFSPPVLGDFDDSGHVGGVDAASPDYVQAIDTISDLLKPADGSSGTTEDEELPAD